MKKFWGYNITKMCRVSPKIRARKRLRVNIRDHLLGVGVLELEEVFVGWVPEMFVEELNTHAVCSAQVSHGWVFPRSDYLNARRVVLAKNTGISGG